MEGLTMRRIFVIFFVFSLLSASSVIYSFADDNSVSYKLDKIMETQAQVLKELDEMKAELQIVKIRSSQK